MAMRFDITDLKLFLHVAQTANITAAAMRANMALASASERIRGMEQAAGVALLERRSRGVALTPAGLAVAHHARLMLQQHGRLTAELSSYASGVKGHVRLMANASALSEFLPETLNGFLAEHPGIDVDIEEKPSQEIVRLVAEGLVDIGVVADIVNFSGLDVFPFATDRLVLIMPQRHRLSRRRRFHFRELLREEFVGMVATNALQRHLGQHALEAGKPLKLRARLGSFDTIGRMVENGIGLAIIPENAALRCEKTMAIRIARLVDSWSLRHLHVCARRVQELPAPARQLAEYLIHHGEKNLPPRHSR
jgi:DNA-binding transcriptional LysR family regulator